VYVIRSQTLNKLSAKIVHFCNWYKFVSVWHFQNNIKIQYPDSNIVTVNGQ